MSKMIELTKLESEFIRSRLYGPNKQRRSVAILEPLLVAEYGKNADQNMTEIKLIIEKIFAIGKEATILAADGKDEDSLEYDRLEQRSQEYHNIAYTWMRKCFLGGKVQREDGCPPSISDDVLTELSNVMQLNAFNAKRPICEGGAEQEKQKSIRKKMKFILRFRTWTNDFDKMRDLQSVADEIRALDFEAGKKADEKLKEGKLLANIFQEAFKVGSGSKRYTMETLQKEAEKLHAESFELEKLAREFEQGVKKKQEFSKKDCKSPRIAGPIYNLQGPNPFFVGNLTPSPHWTILIDETGQIFDNTYFTHPVKETEKGRFVAILVPDGCDLPLLDSFHSTEEETKKIASLLDNLLHTKVTCGIMGVTLDGMANVSINYWYNGLERLLDLILRLLPIDNQKTDLDILIENRGSSQNNMVQRCADTSLYRLAKVDATRAECFKIHARVFAKKETTDKKFIAYNGYVDAIACSWNGKRADLVKILNDYGLRNTCLLEGASQNLYEIMDDIHEGKLPSPELWAELLASPDVSKMDSLIAWLLSGIGHILKNNLEKWEVYLEYFISHLDSKAINLRKLEKQVNFLKRYQPEDTQLPPRLRLLWLTAKLAESNHRGSIVVESMKEFSSLTHDLYEEDAPLTCWATLHLAVNFTNAFEFEQANKIVEDYLKLITSATWGRNLPSWIHSIFDVLMTSLNMEPCSPAAVPGLQYYAQLISSHGQHEAFLGNNNEAVKFFTEAIRLFRKLSGDGGKKDISQTSAYLLTSLMDQEKPDLTLLQTITQEYFGKNLLVAAKLLAASNAEEEKYRQHILLRYLLSGKATKDLLQTVLAEEKNWKTGYGHPWEMIEFYRALLVSDSTNRMKHLKNAHKLCQGFDATLQVIDVVILGAILLDDITILQEYEEKVSLCEKMLPALGERLRILQEQPQKHRNALEFAKLILPFNFR